MSKLKQIEEKLSVHMKEVFESLYERELKLDCKTMKIVSPGKFESEPFFVPFFYDCSMDHWDHIEEETESGNPPIYWLKLEHEDYINLKINREHKFAGIIESDSGFVTCIYK